MASAEPGHQARKGLVPGEGPSAISRARAEPLHLEVVYCPRPGVADVVPLQLPPGSTLADALRSSGVLQRHGLSIETVKTGVWGQLRGPESALRDRDRVEIYRALRVDPKEARRQRYQRHKGKTAV